MDLAIEDEEQFRETGVPTMVFTRPLVNFQFQQDRVEGTFILHGQLLPSQTKQGWEVSYSPHQSHAEGDLFSMFHEMLTLRKNESILKETVNEQSNRLCDQEKLSIPASLFMEWLTGDHTAGEALSDWFEENKAPTKAHNLRILLKWWKEQWDYYKDLDKIINGDPLAPKPQGTIRADGTISESYKIG